MVNIDRSGERSGWELAGGNCWEDLADRVHHVLAYVCWSEEVVDGLETKTVKHPREEQISEMNNSK